MLKVLWCWFQQCFCTFTMLLVDGSSVIGLFRHLSEDVSGVRNIGKTKSMRVVFFLKICKTYCRFPKSSKKLWKYILLLRLLHLNWYHWIVSIKNRILFISSQWVKRQSQDLTCEKQRLFPTQRTWQWSLNMTKMLSWRFQQCLGTFTMFLVKGFSQGVFLDIYLTTFSESVILKL